MDVRVNDGTVVVPLGDCLIALWQAPCSPARWKWHVEQLEALIATNRQGILYVDLILPSSNPPGTSLRAMMQADFRRFGPGLRQLLVVPLGDGLWLSLVRTIVRGTLLITGQSQKQTVLASIDDCLDAVQRHASLSTPSRVQVRAAIDALFQQLGATQPNAA